jgi:predicted transposase/invertase (TIGR01784 family)
MNVNRTYKNSVFSRLFSDPEVLRELYSAIEGIPLSPDTPIDINTLSDVLFMEQYNDISFTIDNKLVILIEHQSTINPNMPIRLLMYLGRIYEKILDWKKLYTTSAMTIPRPEFIVLYNGKSPCPDVQTLRLSDLFAPFEGLKPDIIPSMDLIVTVYNINKGHNEDRLMHSETLRGYSAFVDKVRECRADQNMPLDESIHAAITYCLAHNILSNFFHEHGTEVVSMLITEWNTAEYGEVQREEGREEGLEEGLEKGLEKGREETLHEVLELLKRGYTSEQLAATLSSKKTDK